MNEIIKEFKINDHTTVKFINRKPQIHLDGKNIEELTQDQREKIFCENNPDVKKLLITLLKDRPSFFKNGKIFLKYLIRLGDMSARDVIKEFITQAFEQHNITFLESYYKARFFYYFSDTEKEQFYYNSNKNLRNFINEALNHEEYALKFGFPFLQLLYNLNDSNAEETIKKYVEYWLFHGNTSTIKTLIGKYINPIQRIRSFKYRDEILKQQIKFFTYAELEELSKIPDCPKEFINYFEKYKQNLNTIVSFTREEIVTKDRLERDPHIPKHTKVPDSEYFLILYNERRIDSYPIYIPIYNNQVKKIIINSSESSPKAITEKFEELRTILSFLFEYYDCTTNDPMSLKNTYELYLFNSRLMTDKEIQNLFSPLKGHLKIEFLQIKYSF